MQTLPPTSLNFWIKILSGSNPYAWQEVQAIPDTPGDPNTTYTFADVGGWSGTVDALPAYEVTGNTGVAVDTITRAWIDPGSGRVYFREATASGATLAAMVKRTTAHTSQGVITWNSLIYDSGNFFNSGSPTKLTIPVEGIYLAGGHGEIVSSFGIIWSIDATGISLDGTTNLNYGYGVPLAGGTSNRVCPLAFFHLSAGDYITMSFLNNAPSISVANCSLWIAKM